MKPKVFISHFVEEKQLAQLVKDYLLNCFHNMIDCFISSYDLELADDFPKRIKEEFSESCIVISLCSPQSIQRPWINAGGGACFLSDKPCVPICHSGLSFNELPLFFNRLQGMTLTSDEQINKLVELISKLTQIPCTYADASELLASVSSFEENYTFWNRLSKAIADLSWNVFSAFGGMPAAFLQLLVFNRHVIVNRNDVIINAVTSFQQEYPGIIRSGYLTLPNTPDGALTNQHYLIELDSGYDELMPQIRERFLKCSFPKRREESVNTQFVKLPGIDRNGASVLIEAVYYIGRSGQPHW